MMLPHKKGRKTMINENIKHFRKEKGLNQEELAVKLHVVRQTVSKWENGLSVPDADVLIRLANVLGVSVSQLLGIETEPNNHQALADQLADLNEQLALKNQQERNRLQAGRKRGTILFLTFLTMLVALIVKNELVSLLLTGVCMISAAIILYRNLALLTNETTDDLRIGTLRVTTLINIGFLIIGILVACLTALDVITFSENGEKIFAMAFISCIMLASGILCPRIPYNRYTGLRLPWTIRDEETWKIAHNILGHISLPIVLLYVACTLTVPDFGLVTSGAMILWIGIPGGISGVYYLRKYHGHLG